MRQLLPFSACWVSLKISSATWVTFKTAFPKQIPLEELSGREQYNPEMLAENLMFGKPDGIIAKLKQYEALGVDEFIYYASMGLGHAEQKRSLELFCNEVMPAFA